MLHQAYHGNMHPWQDAPCYHCGMMATTCTLTRWLPCTDRLLKRPDRLRTLKLQHRVRITNLKP